MDTKRLGLLLISLGGACLVLWNVRNVDSSMVQENAGPASEPKDGFDKLAPGQSVAYESMSPSMKSLLEPLTDVVVLRTWAAPYWLHTVSASGKDRATRELRTRKLRECPLTLLMQWLLDEGCVQKHSMVIDIGMNLGWFTALAAAHGLQVVAFEPSPTRVQYMAKTLELNGWTSVQLRHGALANEPGHLFVDESRWWDKRSASREGGDGKMQAAAMRLDNVVPADTKVCLLKADCRGCEAEAFHSGQELLEAGTIQVVQMEYDNSAASKTALETLQGISPHPWQCILLPMGITCSGSDLADKDGEALQELWDFVAGNVHEDCSSSTLEELLPPGTKGYHTDMWLVHADTMDRLRAHPNFVAAQQRLAEAQGQQCDYAEQQVEPGVCELMCRHFDDMEEAKKACSARPTCTKVLATSAGGFELRAGANTPGATQASAFVKLNCQ